MYSTVDSGLTFIMLTVSTTGKSGHGHVCSPKSAHSCGGDPSSHLTHGSLVPSILIGSVVLAGHKVESDRHTDAHAMRPSNSCLRCFKYQSVDIELAVRNNVSRQVTV